MSCSKPSPYLFLPVILVQVDLNFSRPKNAFPEVVWLFLCFWKSVFRPCLHLVVKPLYLLWWSLLLIVDFDSDTSTSWRVFFSWLDLVKGFLFTMERILRSSTTVVLRGHPCLFMLLSSPVIFFSQNVWNRDLATPNVPATSLMDLFCFWSLTIVCFTCMESSLTAWLWFHSNSFQMQMPLLESNPDLLPAYLMLTYRGIAHICPWNSFWVNCQYLWSLKRGEIHIKEL